MKLLEKLLCPHEWQLHKEIKVYDENYTYNNFPVEIRQILVCKKCGKIEKIKL